MGLEAKIMFLDQLERKLCPKSVIFGKFGGNFEKSCEAFMKTTFFEKTQNRTWSWNCIGTKKNEEPIENFDFPKYDPAYPTVFTQTEKHGSLG